MNKVDRDINELSPDRRALYDAIEASGLKQAQLSRMVGKKDYFVNKYLWQNNPQELQYDVGLKLSRELGIDPKEILGERYTLLTDSAETRVIEEQKGVGNGTRAENKKMDVIYDLAVEALSKLSAEDMVKAISDATDLSAQRNKQRNPRSREITS